MDQSIGDTSTYTLITELCGHLLKKHCVAEQHPYIPQKDYSGSLKKLRSKAYGILLNKSPETHEVYVSQRSKDGDPIVELFKHSFVLKVGKKFVAKAEELESLLNELINTENDRDSAVYSTLQLLVGLKQLESEEQEQKLNVFHYGKANPLLPGSLWNGRGVTPFQIYPMESFVIPQIFENMLGIQHSSVIQNCAVEPGSRLLFLGRFKSTTTMAIESIQSGNPLVSMASLSSRGMVELAPSRHYNMPSHFFPNIVEDVQEVEDDCYVENEDSISEEASSWKCVNYPQTDPSNSDSWEAHASDQIFNENSSASQLEFCDIWENMVTIQPVSNYRTWETLGQFDPPKQPHFITETPQAMFHLRRIKLANFLQMTSVNDEDSVNLIKEIPSKQFLSDLKLLLLGIESESFVYDSLLGFQLQPNLAIPGLSIEGLKAVCDPVTQWGNCFKALTILTSSNSQTSELEQKGLIFKAMCNKIKEVLLRHRLAIGRLSVDEGSTGLLALLDKVRPLCVIITELSRLCRCDSQNEVELDNGLGILTHIYQEVTKITQPRVAFVFYSILKACCEVYFWFLQKWLFEGVCDDVYGEFMIKVKPQYLRQRGHRFWTKGFAINQKSVPGFLKELTDAILQCGKAVRLLKVCDSKNPLCSVLATSYPAVRVCLSVGQLREQQMHCNEYLARGRSSCGPIISLCSALQEEREILKKKAQIVNVVHQEMLVRIKREQEETARQVAQGKRELLAKLKDQAEEAVLRKEKAKEAQLHADQLLMERINREQKEEAEKLQHEKENVRTYYNELAAEADRRKLHADWRIRRMQLFDERIAALYAAKNELWQIKDPSRTPDVEDNAISDKEFPNDDCVNATDKNAEKNVDPLSIENSDCNSDDIRLPAEPDETEVDANANQQGDENSNVPPIPTEKLSSENTTENMEDEEVTESISVKSPRPTVLEIKPISLSTEPIEIRQDLLAKDTLQKNKNRIMGHTVFAGEDYREDRGNTKNNMRNFLFDRTDITNEALANRLRNTGNLDAFTELDIVADKIIANKLDLDELAGTDNMSELQRNKLKILREEYNWTPNNNEMKGIISENRRGATFGLTDHEKCDEMMISSTTEDPLSEMEINRNRNVQHRTDQSCNNVPENKVSVDRNLTDAEKNREKSMAHRTGQEMPTMVIPENIITELTDAQKNRNRNMQHSTDQGMNDVPEEMVRSQPGILTDAQKNRAKVMDQEYHIYGSALTEKFDNDNDLGISFPISKSTSSHQVVLDTTTPMSCTTDNFPLSMSSSTSQFQQCMDTPLSEMSSEMRSVLTTGEILTADTVRSDVTESGFKFPERSPMFPNFLGFGSAAMTPTSESTLTIADVEMIDNTSLHVYLEKSVRIPLQVQSSLVNDAIIKYLLEEHKFLSHLHSLRSYFFLLNGEFAKNLTKSLFTRLYEISSPAELLNSATLNNLLVKALVASLSGSYANSERLSLSVTDVPGQLQVSNPEALECLSLNYKISWPLNIILDEISMLQYSKVFKFLLMVGRVMWVLQEDFHLLKIERKAANSKQYHAIQLFRHSMMQFMTALHNYLTCSVLHASWAEFEKDLEHALTIDQVYLTHVSYIKKILSRCMLNPRGEKVRACLHNIFKVILKFHNRVRSQSWVTTSKGSVHPNYVKLEQLYKAFCELRSYMAHVAEKLANSGYQPHLTHFLNALNINCLYDLNVKRKE